MKFERNRKNWKSLLLMAGVALLLAMGVVPSQAHAQDAAARVYGNLDWSVRVHGFNEGAVCGLQALLGIPGLSLPVPLPEEILGNIWDRTDMMGAAVLAYRLGYRDQAVEAAMCSQIHNATEYPFLLNHPDIVETWLSSQ